MRPTRLVLLAALIAALVLSPAPAPLAAQGAAPAAAQAGPPPEAAPAQQAPGGAAYQGPPRTLRAYWHVFIAFTLAWLAMFGYALSLGRRFRNLEREVDAMRGTS
ncbi:MAG TPA: CcmD family protein [Longimicrobium sp.]|jgi:CcmD family protein